MTFVSIESVSKEIEMRKNKRKHFDFRVNSRSKLINGNSWKGRRAFIVGGGPSLKGFDFSVLKNELTIGINRAFEFFDPTIIFGMDKRFIEWVEEGKYGEAVKEKFISYNKGLKVWVSIDNNQIFTPDIIPLPTRFFDENETPVDPNNFSPSLMQGLGHGQNSGFAALNLAYLLGANPIYLLGFDMNGNEQTNRTEHFHGGHPSWQPNDIYKYNFIPHFEKSAAPYLKEKGVTVINCSMQSKLECFEKKEFNITPNTNTLPHFVCYHTDDEIYSNAAKRLEVSLLLFGASYSMHKIKKEGNWLSLNHLKPKIILEELLKQKKTIIWTDADSVLMRYPELLIDLAKEGTIDFAAHIRMGEELLAGTMLFNHNPKTIKMLQDWIKYNESHTENHDQHNLQKMLFDDKYMVENSLFMFNLPASYCCIFDSMPEGGENPVFMHYQASRQARH